MGPPQTQLLAATHIDAPVWLTFLAAVGVQYVRTLPVIDEPTLVALLPHVRTAVQTQAQPELQVRRGASWARLLSDSSGASMQLTHTRTLGVCNPPRRCRPWAT